MAYTTKTSIGDRGVVVQNGAGDSTTVWLEVEYDQGSGRSGVTCLALTPDEAGELATALLEAANQGYTRLRDALVSQLVNITEG